MIAHVLLIEKDVFSIGWNKPMEINIQNITASIELGNEINLEQCTKKLEGHISYDPKSFPGLIYRQTTEMPVFLLFSSGNVVCTGARSEKSLRSSIKSFITMLSKKKLLSVSCSGVRVQIENIIATASMNVKKFDLEILASVLDNVFFEGNSCLIHKLPDLGVSFLIFETGKIICQGKTSEQKIRKSIRHLFRLIKELKTL